MSDFVPGPPSVTNDGTAKLATRPYTGRSAVCTDPAPIYPALSQQLKEEGKVIAKFKLGPDGAAQEVKITQSSGHVRLDFAAIEAIRKIKCTVPPNQQTEEPTTGWITKSVRFKLED
ncbi:energy transducer TonB (plasmid) [Ralstonia sp. 25C]|uniref:energy transducer TonB n=1 Tax=Ralstonia sp. 25C TaxID=3447363 RepID=UPI003F74CF72